MPNLTSALRIAAAPSPRDAAPTESHGVQRPSDRDADRHGVRALLLYLALSVLFFGRSLFGHFSASIIGKSPDPDFYIWCLVWLPYAISHRINPFFSPLVWAPTGASLAWATFLPLVGLVAWPITATIGPVATYNVLCLLAPALAGWTTFILCRYITNRYWPSLVGGYIFAFSPYLVCQMTSHLVLILIFPIPLAVYLVLRRVNNDINSRAFVILFALTVVTQCLIDLEYAATLTIFGAIVMLTAAILAPAELRKRLYAALPDLRSTYVLAGVVLSPYLYFMLAFPVKAGPIYTPETFSTDLLNFVIPTPANLWGGLHGFAAISGAFRGNVAEATGYLGVGLILIAFEFACGQWREFRGRLLIASLAITCAASMGALMHIGGAEHFPMLWRLAQGIPLIDKALPARFMMYAFLDLAVIVALWLSAAPPWALDRPAIAILSLVLILPNLKADFWVSPLQVPAFFSKGLYRQYLRENEVVMSLPRSSGSNNMLWQAQTGMYFRLTDGYIGPDPPGLQNWCRSNNALLAFLSDRDVSTIIVSDHRWKCRVFEGTPSWKMVRQPTIMWQLYLSGLKVQPLRVGGLLIYKVPPQLLARYRDSRNTKAGSLDGSPLRSADADSGS